MGEAATGVDGNAEFWTRALSHKGASCQMLTCHEPQDSPGTKAEARAVGVEANQND